MNTSTTPAIGSRSTLASDFLASIVVFLVALPLCMGIAIASGVPPALGLITGIIGGLVVGSISGAPLQVSGPAAGLAVIVWELVQRFGAAGLGLVVLLAGAIQLTAGLFKAGRLFKAVPPAVVHGMLGGIGVLIFASQFHVMVDDKPRGSGLANLLSIPEAIWKGVMPIDGSVHHMAAGIGLLALTTLLLWNKFAPARLKLIPGALVAVVVATLTANLLELPINYVPIPENLWGAVKLPDSGALARLLDPALLAAAVAMAVIASAETLLCAGAVDRMHDGPRTQYDRELAAQGVGNMLCGLLGALPMTGVIVRSSANVEAGARTRLSAILHGAWLLVLVALAPVVLRLVPVSALAAILVFTGYKLVNLAVIKSLREAGRAEVALYFITLTAIVATDLLKGVMLGFSLALVRLLLVFTTLDVRVEHDHAAQRSTLYVAGAATFLRLPDLTAALEQVPAGHELHVRLDSLQYLDHACLEALTTWQKQHQRRGGRVVMDWAKVEQRFRTGLHRVSQQAA